MHADLMSVHWVHRGVPVLIDSGTWSYRFGASHAAVPGVRLRQYLCGPEAHNGVVIDKVDPLGTLKNDFRAGPVNAYVAHDVAAAGESIALTQARMTAPEAYAGFVRGVVHVREKYFVVYSKLPRNAEGKDVHFPLQLDPKVRIVSREAGVVALLVNDGTAIDVVFSQGVQLSDTGGAENAAAHGWVSPHYGELTRAPESIHSKSRDD
jgi:hypothetical protein